MLVIISDLHLTDGTTGLRIPSGAFRLFRERLEDMAYDASKRNENIYKPIREFDLVLLGDIFDLLRSTQWTDEDKGQPGFARPWMNPDDPMLIKKIENIVDGILQQNAKSLDILRSLAEGTAISLPPPTKSGQVDHRVSRDRRSKLRLPVKVNIHYMNGNHDWFFHLPGDPYDRIRQKVIKHMGLQNPKSAFPHDASESKVIQSIFDKHGVTARHGDIYDPFNYVEEKGRNFSCLGDALVVEMFNQIPRLIETELSDQLPKGFFDDLSEMGSIRPSIMTPVWIASLLERHQVDDSHVDVINEIWHNLLENFLDLDFLSELDQPGLDMIDTLEIIFGGLKHLSLATLDNLAPIAEKLINFHSSVWGGGEFGFDENATKEAAYQSEDVRFVVFGHTHGFKVVPLRSVPKNGKNFDQLYINTGTWHPLHELAKADPKKRGFIMHKTMSYAGFYSGDERKGRTYETWTGALDI
jgi:UDP-2,3-diacylglucosamine pyrophosphatase LpxH